MPGRTSELIGRKRSLAVLLAIAMAGAHLLSCQSLPREPKAESMADGIYPVLATSDARGKLQASAQQRVLIHDQRFVKSSLRPKPTWVLLPSTPAVPMELAEEPAQTQDRLLLTFSDRAARRLFSFTRRSVGKRAAVVIGGEVVTVHGIRQGIDGGKLQVSC